MERSNELDEICDAEVKTELSDSFIESFEKGEPGIVCSDPRRLLLVKHNDQKHEFVICVNSLAIAWLALENRSGSQAIPIEPHVPQARIGKTGFQK